MTLMASLFFFDTTISKTMERSIYLVAHEEEEEVTGRFEKIPTPVESPQSRAVTAASCLVSGR
jgi:hypothetical protein